ncbi:unnamed protein product [Vitrella brassicaformis CCMP3155]|uniref:Alkyl transferase n=1 Tax=Vitrella brassicaformis (strain CCMP3155) TaxID=1169540 RepID=A0A0G4GD22_VITBC|nr:unnamed protein product [Vitrella brassicaformis CCMP3155]|eukprot:CEM27154.1 unnamed protein product [Vitrella brassicaformis CCMP3155]
MGLPWWKRRLLWALKGDASLLPSHIAIIMDGNRRFARKKHLGTGEGHRSGFNKLHETLEMCLELGIRHVTVYAFSVDNFNRSAEEVEDLMDLAQEKLSDVMWQRDFLQANEVQIRVAGDMSLLRPSLRAAVEQLTQATQHHSKAILTVCLAYGSRHEMHEAMRRSAEAQPSPSPAPRPSSLEQPPTHNSSSSSSSSGGGRSDEAAVSLPSDGIAPSFDAFLYTAGLPDPDLLIRTSGETRLSDFLLWQVCERTSFYFTPVLWPEMTTLQFISLILHYQIFADHHTKHTTTAGAN